ncbi:phospholipase A and acyltransferase 4-like [Argopecten irradians]|uniref:phospholipase A and acyltransferase 4-like n=1 Tax=Argopecten irradians TaxID=31199 RepID=UPI0037177B8C
MYTGGEEVVHLTGDLGNASDGGSFSVSGVHYDKAMVKIENFFDVAGGRIAKKNNDKDKGQRASGIFPRPTSAIVRDALAMKDRVMEYNIFFNNCEHFASYLRYGEKRSEQADTAIATILIGGAVVVVGGLIRSWFNRKD